MLFNSHAFIFAFLPASLVGFFLAGRLFGQAACRAWLVVASLFFYGWWNPNYVILIGASILFNYAAGLRLVETGRVEPRRKAMLGIGVAGNLLLLGYCKYAGFFVETGNALLGTELVLHRIVLPLAISFFTFQQIAYLVDLYRREAAERSLLHYALFVLFFPQLIAGPIVHLTEVRPQFSRPDFGHFDVDGFAVGVTIFIIGLFKKVALADNVAPFATSVFAAAEAGQAITFFEAWGGALAYTLQLYFDFSGYADMAIGLGLMFGIRLPLNFDSPYKAASIIDFWRRWHVTLSRFLRDYLYIPLGGSRRGPTWRHVNLLITMLLGGLWHGAGWTFVIWGGLHGLYLVLNHGWRHLRRHARNRHASRTPMAGRAASIALTFVAVVVAWVFFRAESVAAAVEIVRGMIGLNGAVLDERLAGFLPLLSGVVRFQGTGIGNAFGSAIGFAWIATLLAIAWFAPNTQALVARLRMDRAVSDTARPFGAPEAVTFAAMAAAALAMLGSSTEFLYFNF